MAEIASTGAGDPGGGAAGGRPPALAARGIEKSYGPTRALRGVSVAFESGEVHALVGENGAGKSTLKKVFAGEERHDVGTIEIAGSPVRLASPIDARQRGIAVVHQHFPMAPAQSVAENLHLGEPPLRGPRWLPRVDRAAMVAGARAALDRFGLAHVATRAVRDLNVAERQVAAIATALRRNARIIILDEPTSSLDAAEVETLFENMRRVRDGGACVIFITHSMEEVMAVADRVTVLRDGERIDTVRAADADTTMLVRMIVGRDLARGYPKAETRPGETALAADGVDVLPRRTISVAVRRGEILGLPSHLGSGVDEFLKGVSGQRPFRAGRLSFEGRDLTRARIGEKIRAGICLVPGDATLEGLVPKLSIEENVLLANLGAFTRLGVLRRGRLRRICTELIARLDIRPARPDTAVENLSGGNRQKVVIAKWLAAGAKLLVMDDPTRGVDVGAKMEIYSVIGEVVVNGGSVVLGSTDLDELMGLSDRIAVVREGEVVGEFDRPEFDKVAILDRLVGARRV